MYLTLEVVSPQAASMGAEQRKIVGPKGLTIGRVPGNDWIFPDPYISKHHARISYSNGSFLIEGLGRNPIALGRSDNAVAANQPRPLRHGDRLFIDQYEITVAVMQGDPPGTASPVPLSEDPFELISPAAKPGSAPLIPTSQGVPDEWDNSVMGSPIDTATLDPLAALGGNTPDAEPSLPPVNWQQASPLADHVDLPPVRSSAPASGGIPDNWDRSRFTHMETPKPVAPEAPRPAPPPRRPPPPPQRATPPAPPRIARPSAPAPSAPPPPRPTARPEAPPPRSSVPPPQPAPVYTAGSPDLAELLRGAGLSDRDLSPETMNELGKVLRVVVQGVMEVLQARSEIKSQFRLPLTRVQAAENNPLKLSPNVESALHTLLVQRNAGYLATVPAFEDAFADIRAHQMAMLEGLRAGFEATLASFAPEELEKHFERAVKRGGLLASLGAKSKYWELYVERFEQLQSAPDDTFRQLFGDVFAEAYEQQLERFKISGRHSGRK
jgi:type VI secretion system FHA domain protein